MSGTIIFFSYITASLIGMAVLALVMVLCLKGGEKNSRIHRGSFLFILNVVLTSVLYFALEYFYNTENVWSTDVVLRGLDFFLLYSLPCTFAYMAYCFSASEGSGKIFKVMGVFTLLRILVIEVENIFVFNEYYEVAGQVDERAVFCLSLIFILVAILLVIRVMEQCFRSEKASPYKRYLAVCGLMIIINELNSLWWELAYSENFYTHLPSEPYIEIIGFALMIIGVVSIIVIFHSDLSSFPVSAEQGQEEQMEERLDALICEFGITKREREIMQCIYRGMNNSEIAEELFISINTVKHHIYNAYHKLGISSRTELICQINSPQSFAKGRKNKTQVSS